MYNKKELKAGPLTQKKPNPFGKDVDYTPFDGASQYMYLTDEEIAAYEAGGYIVEEDGGDVYFPSRNNPANDFAVTDPRSMAKGGAYYDDSRDAWVYEDGTVGPNGPAYFKNGGDPGKGKKGKSKNVKPFVTSDPKEYAYRKTVYEDSLNLYNQGERNYKQQLKFNKRNKIPNKSIQIENQPVEYKNDNLAKIQPIQSRGYYFNYNPDVVAGTKIPSNKVNDRVHRYKKPVQPVQFKKPGSTQGATKKIQPIVEQEVIEPTPVPQPTPIPKPVIVNPELQKFVEERRPEPLGTGADVMPVYNTDEVPMYATPDPDAEWVGDIERYVDWDGNKIPYRLPRFRKPGHGGDLIKQGKKRYIPFPSIESRYQAEIVPEEEFKKGGEPKNKKKDSKGIYRSKDGSYHTTLTPEMQAAMSPDEWAQYVKEVPSVLVKPTAERMNQYYDDKYGYGKDDSLVENALEFVDPTGVTSWDDAAGAAREWELSGNKIPTLQQSIEMFGAVPGLGKFGKLKYLASVPDAMKAVYKFFPWQKAINAYDTQNDINENNIPDVLKSNVVENKYLMGGALNLPWYKYAGDTYTHYGMGGNTDPGNNALELHMFYDKDVFKDGGEPRPKEIGPTYYYPGRTGSEYKLNDSGQWTIKNSSTNGKFVPIKDSNGTRSAELDRHALDSGEFAEYQKNLKYQIENPKAPQMYIKDTRTVRATSGKPINPNVDLKSSSYNQDVITNVIKRAKAYGVDPATAVAVGLQESMLGKTDTNIGHMLHGDPNDPYAYIPFLKQSMERGKNNLGYNDIYRQLQVYNGLGVITPQTEKKYHGYSMGKIYGVPIPTGGINMRQNPLYGKEIMDIRNNVLMKNPQFVKLLKQTKPRRFDEGGSYYDDELTDNEIQALRAAGYQVDEL